MGSLGRRIDRSTTDQDSALVMRWTKSKFLTAQLLRQGLLTPRHLPAKTVKQAKEASQHIGFPLVIKPADLERGEGVAVDVQPGNLEAAFNDAIRTLPKQNWLKNRLLEYVIAFLLWMAGFFTPFEGCP